MIAGKIESQDIHSVQFDLPLAPSHPIVISSAQNLDLFAGLTLPTVPTHIPVIENTEESVNSPSKTLPVEFSTSSSIIDCASSTSSDISTRQVDLSTLYVIEVRTRFPIFLNSTILN